MRLHWFPALSFLIAMSLSQFAASLEPWDDMRVEHAWNDVPVNWESLGHPSAGTAIDLYIALKPYQESALTDTLYEVSDPKHPRYGSYLLKEQVAELVKPHPDALDLIGAWLAYHGIPSSSLSMTHGGAWVTVTDVLVSQANRLLNASYQLYRNINTNDTIIRTVGYSLPTLLHTHIHAVAPTTHFTSMGVMQQTPRRRSSGTAQAASERHAATRWSFMVTPEYLQSLYKTSAYVPVATAWNRHGVAGFLNDFPSPADLRTFMAFFRTDGQNADYSVQPVNGGAYVPDDPSEESNVGIQYTEGLAYPTPVIFYSTGNWDGDPLIMFLHYLVSEQYIPPTISISYAVGTDHILAPGYMTAACSLFAQLAVRGITILVGSGINGVGAGSCQDPSGNVRFKAEFPSTCPYVTSVGGTTKSSPEIAASMSGGGFSSYFPRPPYQDHVVPQYFLQPGGNPYPGRYNPLGRGYPDISAQALNYAIVINNIVILREGSGCAVATVASIIALLNDFLISRNKPPLGFLNLLLYTYGIQGLNDITEGSNPGCGTDGFSAVPGWDPVTGLGTPDFEKLLGILYWIITAQAQQSQPSQ